MTFAMVMTQSAAMPSTATQSSGVLFFAGLEICKRFQNALGIYPGLVFQLLGVAHRDARAADAPHRNAKLLGCRRRDLGAETRATHGFVLVHDVLRRHRRGKAPISVQRPT